MKLKRIMQTILSLGNALNQGTARGELKHHLFCNLRVLSLHLYFHSSGSAVGFRLDSLPKLAETRARNNKLTLIHYLCKVVSSFPLYEQSMKVTSYTYP